MIMLIAFIVYLVVGVLAIVATANSWICEGKEQGWSLLSTIIIIACATLIAPICFIIGFVREIYRDLH